MGWQNYEFHYVEFLYGILVGEVITALVFGIINKLL